MKISTGGPVLTVRPASHLSNHACRAKVHWIPRRLGQQPEPWSHWPSHSLSLAPRPSSPRLVNHSAAETRAASSLTPWTRKIGIEALIAPSSWSRSACQALYAPLSCSSPAVAEDCGSPQPVSSMLLPKSSPPGSLRSMASCSYASIGPTHCRKYGTPAWNWWWYIDASPALGTIVFSPSALCAAATEGVEPT